MFSKRAGLIFFQTLFGLFVAELTLFLNGYPPWFQKDVVNTFEVYTAPNVHCGWMNRPGRYRYRRSDANFTMRVETDGARTTSLRSTDAADELILTGDSYTFGYGLDDKETFGWLIQSALPGFKVRNFGVPGFGTTQSYLIFQYVANLEPRSKPVTVFYFMNAFHEERNVGTASQLRVTGLYQLNPSLYWPLASLDLHGSLIISASHGEPLSISSRWFRTSGLMEDFISQMRHRGPQRRKREVTEKLLLQFAEAARKAKTELKVVLLDMDEEARLHYNNWLGREKIEFLDLRLAAYAGPQYRLPDFHPNPALNGLIAQKFLNHFDFSTGARQ